MIDAFDRAFPDELESDPTRPPVDENGKPLSAFDQTFPDDGPPTKKPPRTSRRQKARNRKKSGLQPVNDLERMVVKAGMPLEQARAARDAVARDAFAQHGGPLRGAAGLAPQNPQAQAPQAQQSPSREETVRNIRTVVEALDDASVARLAGLQDATAQLSVTAASEQEFEAGKAVLAERFPEFANEIANETFARADENIFESVALRAAIADKTPPAPREAKRHKRFQPKAHNPSPSPPRAARQSGSRPPKPKRNSGHLADHRPETLS